MRTVMKIHSLTRRPGTWVPRREGAAKRLCLPAGLASGKLGKTPARLLPTSTSPQTAAVRRMTMRKRLICLNKPPGVYDSSKEGHFVGIKLTLSAPAASLTETSGGISAVGQTPCEVGSRGGGRRRKEGRPRTRKSEEAVRMRALNGSRETDLQQVRGDMWHK